MAILYLGLITLCHVRKSSIYAFIYIPMSKLTYVYDFTLQESYKYLCFLKTHETLTGSKTKADMKTLSDIPKLELTMLLSLQH